MLQFSRSVHTRSKRVSVQLLKDFRHVGQRGEVVQVTEGLMRNKLHPNNGAIYMVPHGAQIPIVKKQYKERKAVLLKQEPEKKTILNSLVFEVPEGAKPEAPVADAAEAAAAPSAPSDTKFAWQNQFVNKK